VRARLARPFELAGEATFDPARRSAAYPATAREADELWERLLAAWVISERLDERTPEEALEAVRARMERMDRSLGAADVEYVEERFLNAVLQLRDPHSGYHAWDSVLDLEVSLAGSFVGIGAEIRRVGGRATIAALSPGGAAEETGAIRPDDRLVALAEEGAALQTTEGMRLREIVRRLRGEPGTRVRLAIEREGVAGTREVIVERRRVAVTESRARAFVFTVDLDGSPGAPVGVIELPSFYGETGSDGTATSSSAEDVDELLRGLRERGVCGIVLDLRGNPGGRTDEAVRIAGHFIDTGPVMMLVGGEGGAGTHPAVESDPEPGMIWDGPLVVLTSASSASASELVAGALQCYRRALVVGSGSTHGKGTSQSVIRLSEAAKRIGIEEGEHFGLVRITGQKFFLPDGRSNQRLGVASDIVVASASRGDESGEASLPGALAWSSVPVGAFDALRARAVPAGAGLDDALRARLLASAGARASTLAEFDWDRRRMAYRATRYAQGPVDLNLESRVARRAALDQERRVLTAERRRLAAVSDFPWSPLTLAVVAKQRAAHEERLGAEAGVTGAEPGAFVARGAFALRATAGGSWRELPLDRIDPELLIDESEALAAAFSEASGCALEARKLRAVVVAMRTDETAGARVLPERLAAAAGLPRDSEAFRLGLVALLARLVELYPPLLGDPAPLDVALRESLRIVREWAGVVSDSPH
jgi:carboxyl-terminal processing protease